MNLDSALSIVFYLKMSGQDPRRIDVTNEYRGLANKATSFCIIRQRTLNLLRVLSLWFSHLYVHKYIYILKN